MQNSFLKTDIKTINLSWQYSKKVIAWVIGKGIHRSDLEYSWNKELTYRKF